MSFLRRQESIAAELYWIPAFAGMTSEIGQFYDKNIYFFILKYTIRLLYK